MKRAIILTIMVLGLSPSSVWADTPFDRVLTAIDTVPTRAALDAQWDDAAAVLMEAARDAERSTHERHRAITLLSLYPDARTRSFLLELARDGASDVEARKMSVYTLGRAFGAVGGDSLVAEIRPFVRDRERLVREWAVRSLRWVTAPAAESLLREVLASSDAELHGVARRALGKRQGVSQALR